MAKRKQEKPVRKRKSRGKKKGARSASSSDPWSLYELSVQEPEAECDLIEQVWRELRGREPLSLREDFCGTALNSIEWVKRGPRRTAIAVDIAPDVLARARERIRKRLRTEPRTRIRLIEGDVLSAETEPVDTVLAGNFSYFIFKTRRKLKRYFRAAREALVEDGLLLLDVYGGSDSFLEMKEPREVDGFTYVWDQAHYNPITGDVINHIHFRFPDGTRLKRAFTYEWRLWTIPELNEILREAGFRDVVVYWEGTDEDGEGNGEWSVSRTGEACAGWVAYVAGVR